MTEDPRSAQTVGAFAEKHRKPPHLRRTRCGRRMAQMGHKDRFLLPRLNARYEFKKETIAGTHGNGRDAPIAVIGGNDPPVQVDRRSGTVDAAFRHDIRENGTAYTFVRSLSNVGSYGHGKRMLAMSASSWDFLLRSPPLGLGRPWRTGGRSNRCAC
jgi:hypothetical protein